MPDLLVIDFETDSIEERVPVQVACELVRWDNRRYFILDAFDAYIEHDKALEDWPAAEFHQKTGFADTYKGAQKISLESAEEGILQALESSESVGRPYITARNTHFEVSILRKYMPRVLAECHPYRFVDMTTLNIHRDLNQIRKEIAEGMGNAHNAIFDVRVEVELLKVFCEYTEVLI